MNDEDEETYEYAPCKGRSYEEFYDWLENCQSLDENESSFAVAEYIEHLFHKNPQDITSILKCPQSSFYDIWTYETARFIVKLLNYFLAFLKTECKPHTCPTLTIGDDESVEIMCAAHPSLQPCCAIDYCEHTLNSLVKLINNNTYFSSRMKVQPKSLDMLKSPFRRLYRILLHAYYKHPNIIKKYREETSLIDLYSNFLLKLKIIKEDDLIVPFKLVDFIESSDSSSE